MAEPESLQASASIVVRARPERVLKAFTDATDLAKWWGASRSFALLRPMGVYAVEWPPTDFEDEVLGRLGGTLFGDVMEAKRDGFFLADVYWHPPSGAVIGPLALNVQFRPHGDDGKWSSVTIAMSAEDEGPRWRRYFALMKNGLATALADLKDHLEWS
jgi:hypothetical protein